MTTDLDVLTDSPARRFVDHRADRSGGIVSRTHRHAFGRLAQPVKKHIVHTVEHDDPAATAALLPRVAERRLDDRLNRAVEVCVIVDDDRVLAAHLDDQFLDERLAGLDVGPRADHAAADLLRSGKGDYVYVLVFDKMAPNRGTRTG